MKCFFTVHAKRRAEKRGITKRIVLEAVKYPDSTNIRHGKLYSQKRVAKGVIEVVYEKTKKNIKIITVYWV